MANDLRGGENMECVRRFLKEEDGMGVVEVILIIVVLISLVLIFKTQITSIVNTLLRKVKNSANSV